jgi:hypothetical protein
LLTRFHISLIYTFMTQRERERERERVGGPIGKQEENTDKKGACEDKEKNKVRPKREKERSTLFFFEKVKQTFNGSSTSLICIKKPSREDHHHHQPEAKERRRHVFI